MISQASFDATRSRRRALGAACALVLAAVAAPSQAAGDLSGASTASSRITLVVPARMDKANLQPCVLSSATELGGCTVAGRQWRNVRFERLAAGAHGADLLLVIPQ